MKLSFNIKDTHYQFNNDNYEDISIPLIFNGPQPNSYKVPLASSKAYKDGSFIGDTRIGGPCNFETIELTPHCNGTHTECIGHITNERMNIVELLDESFIPSLLLSVEAVNANKQNESYPIDLDDNDFVITRKEIAEKGGRMFFEGMNALILRTLPNNESKQTKDYMDENSPFFTNEAMEYINSLEIDHLVVDLPSIDRTLDEGKLSNHHIFWNVEQGKHELSLSSFTNKTITEFAFIKNSIKDGKYLLNLQIAPFMSDAAPSRPLIFKMD